MAAQLGGSEDAVRGGVAARPGQGPAPHPTSGRPTIGHETAGVPLVETVCDRYSVPNRTASWLCRCAVIICDCHRLMEARPATVMKLLEQLDALAAAQDVSEFVLACEADYRGRQGREQRAYPQGGVCRRPCRRCWPSRPRARWIPGLDGPELGAALRRARIQAIADLPVEPGQ